MFDFKPEKINLLDKMETKIAVVKFTRQYHWTFW